LIKATPHEWSGSVRNRAVAEEVFKQQDIYVIKDLWLDNFPDTMKQFGNTLIKDGEEFHLGESWICKYRKAN